MGWNECSSRGTMVAPVEQGGAGKAPATVQKVVQVFNKCLRAALEDRLIPFNPAADLPLPKIERDEMRFLTDEEVWHLADKIDSRRPSWHRWSRAARRHLLKT